MNSPFKYQSSWKTSDYANRIRQLTPDPASPAKQRVWVLRTPGDGGTTEGVPMGLLLALTYPSTLAPTPAVYELSYRTKQSTTIRTILS